MTESVDLVERTRQLLINRPKPITLDIVSRECGCSTRFLTMLARGGDRDFTARRVQRVYEYLSSRPLLAK